MDDLVLRHWIYRHFADTGRAPAPAAIAELAGDPEVASEQLRRLHEAHMVVLDDDGAIRMALPFSARRTEHLVFGDGRSWWANCAWDALAIPVALGEDATIEATWLDTGRPVELAVRDGELRGDDGFVHFVVPARHWWDDIVET